ncbi:MAG: sporulation protein [Candidatus Hadarchaeales archaeon]
MVLFGRINPINAKVSVLLDKPTFLEGENITGRVNVESDEAVKVDEIRLEIRATETYLTTRMVHDRYGAHPTTVRETRTVHSENVRISPGFDMPKGFKDQFPFSVSIPPLRPTMPNGVIERRIKGVVAVKGRPDKTHEITVNVSYAPQVGAAPAPAQVVVKEIVKVPCKYCGALIPVESERCPNCGAKFSR